MAAQALGAGFSRSETALEGIALLRRGSVVKKYGRQGKPHETLFKLSADETVLAWEGHGLKRLKRRAVQVADLEELCVGHESDVFQRLASSDHMQAAAHMSLTLKMASESERAAKGRETLDLSCDDEETFGLWVAALRALIADRPALLPNDQQRRMLKVGAARPKSSRLGIHSGASISGHQAWAPRAPHRPSLSRGV
tara:strand:- start:837 stop:1427 length:591 start_codon:yes stop_codon:yes gene_type:complete